MIANTYRLEQVIGRGGMGSVFLATHKRLPGKQVAIKVLHAEVADADVLARFNHEATITSQLNHPNIVQVNDFDVTPDGTPYLVLEYLEGETLAQRLRAGPIALDHALSIMREVGSALAAAHRIGVVHRDLKPQNIFLVRTEMDGRMIEVAKVLDFGISKMRSSQTVKTLDNSLLGTPQYMSPEQAIGQHTKVDERTDVFALGSILYEMLCGHPAFSGASIPEVVFKVVYEQPLPIADEAPLLPRKVTVAIETAMAKTASERYATVGGFVEALTGEPLALPHASGQQAAVDGPASAARKASLARSANANAAAAAASSAARPLTPAEIIGATQGPGAAAARATREVGAEMQPEKAAAMGQAMGADQTVVGVGSAPVLVAPGSSTVPSVSRPTPLPAKMSVQPAPEPDPGTGAAGTAATAAAGTAATASAATASAAGTATSAGTAGAPGPAAAGGPAAAAVPAAALSRAPIVLALAATVLAAVVVYFVMRTPAATPPPRDAAAPIAVIGSTVDAAAPDASVPVVRPPPADAAPPVAIGPADAATAAVTHPDAATRKPGPGSGSTTPIKTDDNVASPDIARAEAALANHRYPDARVAAAAVINRADATDAQRATALGIDGVTACRDNGRDIDAHTDVNKLAALHTSAAAAARARILTECHADGYLEDLH